ncbi:MAG: TonB-dependent receptor plug domain-containing protein [Phascolarctobacterium sp.]|nr:TonB-dependent receptor plug domain-containing protein [Phascolarctobacterium sp.]
MSILSLYLNIASLPVYAAEADDNLGEFELETITVEARRPDWEAKLSPGTVTVVRPDDFKGEQKTLADMLLTVPGVHVREVNGKGQYTTVTVRGSTAAQVGVFIDGVLANLGGDAAVDISTIPVKNVERIEIYRGYIPSRFGGTFIGGVINVVTKKPTQSNVSVELGKSSYGGKKGSLEVVAPAGSGSLMLALNHESSDGDFKYENYASQRYVPRCEEQISSREAQISNFNNNNIDVISSSGLVDFNQEQIDYYKSNNDAWVAYVKDSGSSGLANDISANRYNYVEKSVTTIQPVLQQLVDMGIKEQYLDLGYSESGRNSWAIAAETDWKGSALGEGIITDNIKSQILKEYADNTYQSNIDKWQNQADPDKSDTVSNLKKQIAEWQKRLAESKSATRYRKYNDYNNTDAIIKWQNEDWVIKGTYKKIDRHLPDSLWGGGGYTMAPESNNVDLYDVFYYDSRRQDQETYTLMTQNRHQSCKLEWGWMVDYQKQDKKYNAERILPNSNPAQDWDLAHTPLREWSNYNSNKGNIQIDGSYKLSEKSMLDFQMNYSKERLKIEGSNMDKVLQGDDANSILAQMRDQYDQDILNLQIQNSITLDDKATWVLTPALRYNQSKITGYSNGKRFDQGTFNWLQPQQSQLDSKTTWQLALKKEFSEDFAMRMTGGTYYRLLNMTEIAGDGAGILPAPANKNGGNSLFPRPEEGKQFDISAIFKSNFLGASNSTTLTYYWRDSEYMLQLVRAGKDYWCYFNDNRGTAKGVELQSSLKWAKFDLDVSATYLKTKLDRMNSIAGQPYYGIWATYQPEWEGNIRLTYHPTDQFESFLEAHYTDEYFTNDSKSSANSEEAYLSGKPVDNLLVYNAGIKLKPKKNCQFVFGVNDIFNKGPEMKIKARIAGYGTGYINPEFPIQGRTYYVTAKFDF